MKKRTVHNKTKRCVSVLLVLLLLLTSFFSLGATAAAPQRGITADLLDEQTPPRTNILNTVLSFFQSLFDYFMNIFGKEEDADKMAVYFLSRNSYYQLFETPTPGILDAKENLNTCYTYSKSVFPSMVKREFTSAAKGGFELDSSTSARVGHVLVWPLIPFVTNTNALEEYLSQNGVTGKVEKAVVIYYSAIPTTIWVVVDQENFFITVDEDNYEDEDDSMDYRLYDCSAYVEKFSPECQED